MESPLGQSGVGHARSFSRQAGKRRSGKLVVTVSPAASVEWGKPTPEQAARCEAQANLNDQNDCSRAYSVNGLKFPAEAEEPGFFTNTARMGIFKPGGSGPFPALILMHTCAAVDFDPRHMPYWVSQALKAGYAAFVVDSWDQRGISEHCRSSPVSFLPIHIAVRTRDAYDALEHLAAFDFIDHPRNSPPRRVIQLGDPGGVYFAYDREITEATRVRVFEFLARHLRASHK